MRKDQDVREGRTPPRLALPDVTLCAVTSANVAATIAAMEACTAKIDFGAAILLTDGAVRIDNPAIEVRSIPRLVSTAAYSTFLLRHLLPHIATSHCLVVQWDGHVLDAARWQEAFLEFDYIGARWPQFGDGSDVGNGGFSLRSRRLLQLCAASEFDGHHPEDVAICRTNRAWLEAQGIRFAPGALADAFSTERAGTLDHSFGYHGAFNMPKALGAQRFWEIYRTLDAHGSVWYDFWRILLGVLPGRGGISRGLRLAWDRIRSAR